jgi:hypothetical protein
MMLRERKDRRLAEAELAALREEARREVGQAAAMVLVERTRAENAEAQRDRMREAARAEIRAAFTAAQGDYARLVDELRRGLTPIVDELRRACSGTAPETLPASDDERVARVPEVPVEASPYPRAAAPVQTPRSAEDEARIAQRFDELAREAAQRDQDVGHCYGMFCGEHCVCGCAACVGHQQLLTQAENEVLHGGLRAAGFGRPSERRTGVTAEDASAEAAHAEAAAPMRAPASQPTLVSPPAAAHPVRLRPVVEVRGA